MIALVACVLASTVISLLFKLFARYGVRNLPAIVVNYFVCVACGTAFEGRWLIDTGVARAPWLPLALVLGLFFIGGFNLNALCVQRAGIAVTSVVQRISLVLSVGFAVLVLGDELTARQAIGIALGVVAVLLVVRLRQDQPPAPEVGIAPGAPAVAKTSRAVWLLPLAVFLVAGAIESGLTVAERTYDAGSSTAYTVTLFLWAGLVGLAVSLFAPVPAGRSRFTQADILGGIALGIPNFFSIHLVLVALDGGLAPAVVFPVLNVATIVLGALLAVAFFAERLSAKQWGGVAVAVLAIALITLGS